MPSTPIDRLYGLTTSVAVKPPVQISADYNVVTFGEQTITSSTLTGTRTVVTTKGMRVLLTGQEDPIDNGIWEAMPATWRRSPDFDGSRDAVNGTLVFSVYGDCWQVEATDPVRIGYDEINFRSTYPFSADGNLFQRSLRVPDTIIPEMPSLADMEGKLVAISGGRPVGVLPQSGSASDVMIQLASQNGASLVGYRGYTVKDRLDEVISVMAIPGVKGDGVTDDQPAIQAYINANSPREIFFPSGHDYFFGSTLTISSVSTYVHGSKGYPGGSRIICGTPNMSAILSTNYGARFEDLAIVGPASERLDDSIAFGQSTTCTGISFLRGDGSKDIDSDVSRVAFQHLKKGIYGKGCNLKATGCLFTSVLQPHYYEQLDSATEIRGMIITECRYHHLGGGGASLAVTYPELLTSACVTILGVFSRGNVITDNYADAQIRTFFKGQLGRASKLSDNIIFRAEGDVFVIDNTAMISSYEVFESSGNVLSNDTPDLNNLSGYMYNLTGVSGGVIYGNTGSYIRKGGIICTGVTNMRISNNIFKDINRNVDVDGAIYDGVYLNSTSSGNIIDGTFVRNAYSTTQCRSVVNDNGTNNNVTNFTGVNVSNQYLLSSSANTSGILDGRIRKRREIYSDTAPTTGAWVRGDIAWNQSVSSGGSMGRVCTVSGTPGTWSAFGTIS